MKMKFRFEKISFPDWKGDAQSYVVPKPIRGGYKQAHAKVLESYEKEFETTEGRVMKFFGEGGHSMGGAFGAGRTFSYGKVVESSSVQVMDRKTGRGGVCEWVPADIVWEYIFALNELNKKNGCPESDFSVQTYGFNLDLIPYLGQKEYQKNEGWYHGD